MKNINKLFATLIMLFALNANAQDIIVDAATSQVTIFQGGKLNLNGADSKFRSTSTVTSFFTNNGEIHFKGTDNKFTDQTGLVDIGALGSTAILRVPGMLYYSKNTSTGNQNIQSRWYTSLTMDGLASKTIIDGVYIGATYNVTETSGTRSYTDNFYYDGATAQPIFGEKGSGPTSNAYDNLVFQNAGVKTLESGDVANAENFTTESSATGGVVIKGTMTITDATTLVSQSPLTITDGTFETGDGPTDLSGTVTIDGTTSGVLTTTGTGLVTINGTTNVNAFGLLDIASGDVTIAATTGVLTLADAANAELNVDESRTLTVTGTFTNLHTPSVNMTYFDNATNNSTNSTVIYDGIAGQSVVSTVATNAYSNLILKTAAKTAPAAGIVLAGNFRLQDANLDMATLGGTLYMTDDLATADYGAANDANGSEFEVVGKMKRDIISSTAFLTFNNDSTRLAITNPANVDDFTLDVTPDYDPTNAWDYATNENNDIKRRINFDYTVTPNTDWAVEMQYGFKETEAPQGKFDDVAYLSSLRMREILAGASSEKVSTSFQPNRNNGSNDNDKFRAITLATIRGTGGAGTNPPQSALAEVADNAGLFLRGGPALFISVRPGRWSNPATWDEGEQPGATDRAAIRHNVHIGFTSNIDDISIDEDLAILAKGGGTYTNKSTIAAEILINDKFDVNGLESDKATLIVGASSNVGLTDLTNNTSLAALIPNHGGIIVNEFSGNAGTLTQALMDTFKADHTARVATDATLNLGLVVVPNSIFTVPKIFDAKGLVNNGGEVNIGQ